MRTRLRGLEIAGIQIGIEVPDTCLWEWPESAVSDFVCLPRGPEVHIGLRVAELSSADLGGECYGLGAWTFEVAAHGDDWLLGLSRGGVREQLARFDSNYRCGEILISKDAADKRRFPLRTPLDEWIVLQRTVARGGLVLSGSAGRKDDVASIRLEKASSRLPSRNRWATHRMALLGRDTVVLRGHGDRLRNFSTPWNDTRDPLLGVSAPVADLVVIEESERPYRECLDPDEAAELLVAHSIVPLCDERFFDRVLCNARKMSLQVKVLRIGEIAEFAPPMTWQSTHLQSVGASPKPRIDSIVA